MTNEATPKLPSPSLKEVFMPAMVAVIIWLILHITYDLLGFIENVSLYRTLASIVWIMLVISVGFSSIIIYPVAYFRGASVRLRILAVYMLPLAWCIKEFIRVSSDVTAGQALFYVLFTSVQLLIIIGQIALIGLSELFCRAWDKRRGASKPIFTLVPVLASVLSLISLYFILLYNGGYAFHLTVKMIYRSLFL